MNACSLVTVADRTCLRRSHYLTIGIQQPYCYDRLDREAKKDLNTWYEFVQQFNGKSMFMSDRMLSKLLICIQMLRNLWALSSWMYGLIPQEWHIFNITFRELYLIVFDMHIWGHLWKDCYIIFHSDNQAFKEKLINLIEWTFKREGSPYIACNERQAFFTSEDTKRYKLWSCQNVCEALIYLLDNIYISFGTKLYRQIVGIPMDSNCAPLVADLFLFCYERDFMTSLSDVKQAEIIEAFKSSSRYLDGRPFKLTILTLKALVNRIYPPELKLNKANTSDTEAPFLDLHLSISNGFVSSKIYDKRDDFDFDIVNFPFLVGDVPRSTSYGVYISQLIRFARVSSHVADFNARNKSLTARIRQQGYRYHKRRKTFSKFYRRHYELVSKFNVS